MRERRVVGLLLLQGESRNGMNKKQKILDQRASTRVATILSIIVGSPFIISPRAALPQERTYLSSCWRLRTPIGSISTRKSDWALLGGCNVTARYADGDWSMESVYVTSTGEEVKAKKFPNWNGASVKPHWNPTGSWLNCLWAKDNKGICAVVTWNPAFY